MKLKTSFLKRVFNKKTWLGNRQVIKLTLTLFGWITGEGEVILVGPDFPLEPNFSFPPKWGGKLYAKYAKRVNTTENTKTNSILKSNGSNSISKNTLRDKNCSSLINCTTQEYLVNVRLDSHFNMPTHMWLTNQIRGP